MLSSSCSLDWPRLDAQAMSKPMNYSNEDHAEGNNRGLRPEAHIKANLGSPRLLEIADTKPSDGSGKVRPAGNLCGGHRIRIQDVGRHGNGSGHNAESVQAPSHDDRGDVEVEL